MIKRVIVTSILFIASVSAFAQDPQFSQFYASPLYLNPALAGSTRCPRMSLNYRDQWPQLKGTFVTTAVSYDQYVDALQGGVGILIVNDQAGGNVLSTLRASGIYSYQINISREVAAKIGIEATFSQKKYDFTNLLLGDKIDSHYGFIYGTSENFGSDTRIYSDFSTGAIVYSSSMYGGIAISHLTQPSEAFLNSTSDSKLPLKILLHYGTVISLGKDKRNPTGYISPNVLYVQQQGFNQLNIGMYAGRGPFIGGLWYRGSINSFDQFLGSDSFILLAGVQQGIFKFGYSYDITVSRLAQESAGSHELSLGMQFECSPKKKRFKAIKCPIF